MRLAISWGPQVSVAYSTVTGTKMCRAERDKEVEFRANWLLLAAAPPKSPAPTKMLPGSYYIIPGHSATMQESHWENNSTQKRSQVVDSIYNQYPK